MSTWKKNDQKEVIPSFTAPFAYATHTSLVLEVLPTSRFFAFTSQRKT
jgi:hypothetical protein